MLSGSLTHGWPLEHQMLNVGLIRVPIVERPAHHRAYLGMPVERNR